VTHRGHFDWQIAASSAEKEQRFGEIVLGGASLARFSNVLSVNNYVG